MTDKQIKELIDKAKQYRSETTNIEFKDARGGLPKDLWRTISSFSHNPNGGIIVLGIKEDTSLCTIEIVGGLEISRLQEQILSYFTEKMKNHGTYNIRIIDYDNVPLIIITINETPDELKPCFNKQVGLPKGACIRVGNNDRVINDEEMRAFIRNSSVYKYDKKEAENTTMAHLDMEKISDFLQKSAIKTKRKAPAITPEVLRNVGILLKTDANDYVPTFAGYMLFSKDEPQSLILYSRFVIRCIRYKGISVTSPIIDKQDISGNLDHQIDEIQKFILKNIRLSAKIKGTKRIESYEYPEEALREIIANAVIHRDYMITETYTQVNIFSDRIEVSNPGNLPPGITIENIKDSQFSRNEIIAQILKDLDYMEEYGRGINIAFATMKDAGLLEPIFKNSSNTFKVILLGEAFTALNERQVEVWNRLQDIRHITAKEYRSIFPEVSKATISSDLNKMTSLGLILLKGSSTNTYYEPQY